MVDRDALVFDSTALPLTPPDLEEFAGDPRLGFLRLLFEDGQVGVLGWADQGGARFFIAEPGTLGLLGLGLLGLGLTRRRAN